MGAGWNSPHPSSQVKPTYFQLISAEMSENHGAGGQGILSRQVTTYSPNKTIEVQQSEIRHVAEIKDSNYNIGSNQNQISETTNVAGANISLSSANQDNFRTDNQQGEGNGTDGNGLGGAGNSQGKSNIKQARFKTEFKCVYPKEARKKGWEGVVRLEFTVSKDGRVMKITKIKSSGYELLDDAAIEALKKMPCEPTTQDGEPIESIRQIPIRFKLSEE